MCVCYHVRGGGGVCLLPCKGWWWCGSVTFCYFLSLFPFHYCFSFQLILVSLAVRKAIIVDRFCFRMF